MATQLSWPRPPPPQYDHFPQKCSSQCDARLHYYFRRSRRNHPNHLPSRLSTLNRRQVSVWVQVPVTMGKSRTEAGVVMWQMNWNNFVLNFYSGLLFGANDATHLILSIAFVFFVYCFFFALNFVYCLASFRHSFHSFLVCCSIGTRPAHASTVRMSSIVIPTYITPSLAAPTTLCQFIFLPLSMMIPDKLSWRWRICHESGFR